MLTFLANQESVFYIQEKSILVHFLLPVSISINKLYKMPYVILKLLLYTFMQNKSYIVMKCSIKFVSTGSYFLAIEIESIARIISARYFVQSDSFLIALKNSYRQAILTKKMLSPNSKTFFQENKQWHVDIALCLLHLWDYLLFFVGGAGSKIKNKSCYFVKHFIKVLYERNNDHHLSYKKNYYRCAVFHGIAQSTVKIYQ